MGERWLIRLPPDAEGRVTWTNPGDGTKVARRDPLSQVAAMAGRRVVLVVPAEEVWLTRITPPRAARGELLKALPYLLEESLSVPVESLHFVPGERAPGGTLPVAVVAARLMEEWLELARSVGLAPEAVLPDCLLLPLEPRAWSVLLSAGTVLIRTGEAAGFAVDRVNLGAALGLALAESGEITPERLLVWPEPGIPAEPDLFAPFGIPVEWRTLEADPLILLATHDRPGRGIDLARGRFAPASRWSGALRALRPALLLSLVWLAMRGAETGVEAWRLEQRAIRLDQAIQQVFRESVPEVRRVVNPRVQMTRQLEALRGASGRGDGKGFLALLGRAGTALRAIPESVLQGARFGEGKLELTLRLPDLQRLDALKQRVEAGGLAVSIQSASRESEGIAARVRVEAP